MGEIRKDNLHESLIEELNELANIDLSGKQDKTDESLLTESKDLVGAINELFQSANNGKELIASAIGEPLNAEDTFSAMSNDINGLLSTFKTNMMNNGITVESSDKFKSLIDKIATIADSEDKGIHYAEGYITSTNSNLPTTDSTSYDVGNWIQYNVTFIEPLNFTPTVVLLNCFGDKDNYLKGYNITINSSKSYDSSTATVSNVFLDRENVSIYINNITNIGFTINFYANHSTYDTLNSSWYRDASYCVIGVGEEDTTLRDSLASILTDEGVSVTEDDDMASLITKVDEEFTNQVVPTGDAVASDVAKGKTFINNTGEVITGTATVNKYLFENGGDESLYTAERSVINYGNADLTHENGYLKFYCSGSSYQANTIYFTLNEEIDLTDRTAVWFDLSISGNSAYSYFSFGVYEGTGTFNEDTTLAEGYYTEYEGSVKVPFYRAKYRIDVSACTGVHKIGIYLGAYGSYSSLLCLYNIELE